MTRDELFRRTIRHVGEYLERDVSHLTIDSELQTAVPGLDSLKVFEMMLYLEDCFSINFNEEELQKVRTVNHLLDLIEANLAGAGQAPQSRSA